MTQPVKTMKSALLAATMAVSIGVVPAFAGGFQTTHNPITQSKVEGDKVEMSINRAYFETDEGVAKVYKALQAEVTEACEGSSKTLSLHTKYVQKRCEAKLLRELVKSADSKALRKVHFKATAH
ncbi:MAG: UrcA family protein [Litorimonas sp.]